MRPDNIHDALRHMQVLTLSIARDIEAFLEDPCDPVVDFEDVKAAALDAHLLVTWVRDNLKDLHQ
jgi:hypothetical protein